MAHTKRDWGLPIALIVLQTLSLQLAASQVTLVNAMLDTRGQMEPHARSAMSVNTKQDWALLLARIVQQTFTL